MKKQKIIVLLIYIIGVLGYVIYDLIFKGGHNWAFLLVASPLALITTIIELPILTNQNSKLNELALKEKALKNKIIALGIATPCLVLISILFKIEGWYAIVFGSMFLIANDVLDYFGVPTRDGRSQEKIDEDDEETTNEFINSVKVGLKIQKETKDNTNNLNNNIT